MNDKTAFENCRSLSFLIITLFMDPHKASIKIIIKMSPHERTKELKTYRKEEATYLNSQIHIETENYL